jgi:hypothetical protein
MARIFVDFPQSSSNWASTARCCRSWTMGMRACYGERVGKLRRTRGGAKSKVSMP